MEEAGGRFVKEMVDVVYKNVAFDSVEAAVKPTHLPSAADLTEYQSSSFLLGFFLGFAHSNGILSITDHKPAAPNVAQTVQHLEHH